MLDREIEQLLVGGGRGERAVAHVAPRRAARGGHRAGARESAASRRRTPPRPRHRRSMRPLVAARTPSPPARGARRAARTSLASPYTRNGRLPVKRYTPTESAAAGAGRSARLGAAR